jgi:hypothetical protein
MIASLRQQDEFSLVHDPPDCVSAQAFVAALRW